LLETKSPNMDNDKEKPNNAPEAAPVKIGTPVKFTDPETGKTFFGTVAEIVTGTAGIIRTVKIMRSDGKCTYIEVAAVSVQALNLLEKVFFLGKILFLQFKRKRKKKPRKNGT